MCRQTGDLIPSDVEGTWFYEMWLVLDFGLVVVKFSTRDFLFLNIYLPASSFSPPNPFCTLIPDKMPWTQLWYHLAKSLMALLSDYMNWNFSAGLPRPKTHPPPSTLLLHPPQHALLCPSHASIFPTPQIASFIIKDTNGLDLGIKMGSS